MATAWDYSGIVAAAYDQFFGNEPFWDQAFYERRLRANGGRALEVACGTGRLLLPLLRDGLAVEGLDTSPEILDLLRAKARAMNLTPVVYELPMQDFHLADRYQTVFVPAGTFQILVDDAEILASLDCFRRALVRGGELLIPIEAVGDAARSSTDWRERRRVHVAAHDAHVVVYERSAFAAQGGLQHWHLRWEVERRGQAKEVFVRHHVLRRYQREEFSELLAAAGFEGISVHRGYTEAQSADPADDLIFCARRPAAR